ncbi:MAG: hypothetical protein MI861_06810, partial [Pirellulales bacterium]|nr:hypothetical protein [Pirellulales bacterium]
LTLPSEPHVARFALDVSARHGDVDVLINNAGVYLDDPRTTAADEKEAVFRGRVPLCGGVLLVKGRDRWRGSMLAVSWWWPDLTQQVGGCPMFGGFWGV